MKEKTMINQIRTLLGMDVKLAQAKLADGETVLEAESFEAGNNIFVVTEDGNVPVPVGEYEMEDGKILVVVEEGLISEIKEMESETTESEVVETETEKVEEEKMEATPKKTIETVSKETHFSQEVLNQIESLKKENEDLKAKLSEMENKKEAEVEMSAFEEVKPITHNPENKNEVETITYANNRVRSTRDRVFDKLFK